MPNYDDNNHFKHGYFQTVHEEVRTNWPFTDDNAPKRKQPIEKFFVDNKDGETIGESPTMQGAVDLARLTNGFVRPYLPTLDEVDEDNAKTRETKQNNYLAGEKYTKIDNKLPMWANPKWYDHK